MGQVELKLTEKIGEVLSKVSEMSAHMASSLEHIRDMRQDLERAKETASRAKESTDSAHLRLNKVDLEIKPLTDANIIERLRSLEMTVRWGATTIIGAIILGGIGALFYFAKGG